MSSASKLFHNTRIRLLLLASALLVIAIGYNLFYPVLRTRLGRASRLGEWFLNGQKHSDWAVAEGERCGAAPFLIPTDGYIGFLWDDSFRFGHRHQGIDIFGGGDSGVTPVQAAYAGYLTRLHDWKSSLIIRIPHDPLKPDRQIWIYYTHMADQQGDAYIRPEFPPGTSEMYVEAGTLLGYQGNYSGDLLNPVGVHLHFSIVKDGGVDAAHPNGQFLNELNIRNTIDPTPYLGMALNANKNFNEVPVCNQP
jgi:peptidoglycan LD-endopeptidase LytH